MAIDTAARRNSALVDAFGVVIPDGTLNLADRSTMLGHYGYLDALAAVVSTVLLNLYIEQSRQVDVGADEVSDISIFTATSGGPIVRENEATGTNTGTILTFEATAVSGESILIVFTYSFFFDTVSVTFNGVALTKAASAVGGNNKVNMWYLLNPSDGLHDVVVTASGGFGGFLSGYAICYSGVDQSSPIISSDVVEGTAASSTAIVAAESGSVAISFLGSNTVAIHPISPDPSETELHNNGTHFAVSEKSGGTSMTWNFASSEVFAHIAASLATNAVESKAKAVTRDLYVDRVRETSVSM